MDWLSDPIDRLQWAVWHFLATIFWAVDRLVLIGAVLIYSLRKWITNPNGVIDLVMSSMLQGEQAVSLKTFIAGALLLALLLAAFVFILRPLIGSGHSPVDLRKVFLWLVFAGYLFSTGGALFTGLEEFRSQLSSSAYQVAATVNGSVGSSGYNNTQGEVPLNSSEPFSPTVQLFPSTTHMYPDTQEYTGIDVAGAYMFATQEDINGTNNGGTGLPAVFESQYFTNDNVSPWPSNYNADQRQAALNRAVTGVIRMGTGIVPSIFAIQQALIFLALALAAAILIFSLPIALVFAFFTSTEVITLAVVRAYISLLVKTYVTAMILAIFMGFLKFWADSQNWIAFLGMSLLILYFTFQLAHMAVQTITQSLNVVTQAIGQATGTSSIYFDPIKMAAQGAGLAATVGIAAATGGTSLAMGSLISGTGGMGIPGMQTLGFGLALKSRRPGQLAGQLLEQSSGSASSETGASTSNPPQRAQQENNPLQPPSFPPAQPLPVTQASSSTTPSATVPPTMSLAAPTSTSTPGALPPDIPTQILIPGAHATNGSSHEETINGKEHSSTQQNNSVSVDPLQESSSVVAELALPETILATPDTRAQKLSRSAGQKKQASPDAANLRVRSAKGRDASLGAALADIVKGRQGDELPQTLQRLPRAAQSALLGLAAGGYKPREVASIADAVQTVTGVMQYQNVPLTSIPKYFLGPDGNIDVHSKGVRDTLKEAGLTNWTVGDDPKKRADLAYIIGAGLQLERTFNAADIAAAVGQVAAEEGGTADSAADLLGASPSAAWGGRYGAIQSVIKRSRDFGLAEATDVQSFITVAQQHTLEEMASGRIAGLAAKEQALVDRVRARATDIAATDSTNGSTSQSVLQHYVRDVRSVPTHATAQVVPVTPDVLKAPKTEKEMRS